MSLAHEKFAKAAGSILLLRADNCWQRFHTASTHTVDWRRDFGATQHVQSAAIPTNLLRRAAGQNDVQNRFHTAWVISGQFIAGQNPPLFALVKSGQIGGLRTPEELYKREGA
jgi:hypothetical protein